MKYTPVSDTSFKLEDTGAVYSLPSFFSLWQIRQVTKIISELTKVCSKSGSILATVALSAFNDSTGSTEEKVAQTIAKIEKSTGGMLGPQAIEGIGEILDFLSAEYRLATIIATLFLAESETKLSDELLAKRAGLFEQYVDPKILWTGISSFFGIKADVKKSSSSPSKTLEVPKTKSSNRTSARSTGTSTVSNV